MLQRLKEEVLWANRQLSSGGLVKFTWGNVSGIDPTTSLVVIKPSGVDYEALTLDDMVVLDLDGKVVEGSLRPSSDTATHLELYRHYPEIRGVVHTHSTYATAFAQAQKSIPVYGTTHADCFFGEIPCARLLTKNEVETDYEKSSGTVIIETMGDDEILKIPGCLLSNHGVFTWGESAKKATENAFVLEEIAKMAFLSESLNANCRPVPDFLLEKHYERKHGKNAYYGQKK